MDEDPPYWVFEVEVDGVSHGQIYGPKYKRNSVLWLLSKHVLSLSSGGEVHVKRLIDRHWFPADDWRNLAN